MPPDVRRFEDRWSRALAVFRSGDKAGALFLLRALADDGEESAYREVANIYLRGGGGVTRDIARAREWFSKAAAADDAWGYYGLAKIHYYGLDGPPNYGEALRLLRVVDDGKRPLVSLMLGRMYAKGLAVSRDFVRAEEHFKKAAEQGNLIALKELAFLKIGSGQYWNGLRAWARAIRLIFKEISVNPRSEALRSN